MRRSIGSGRDHEVLLRCPPSGRQGDWVVGIGEFGVEVFDNLLRGSTNRQGNVSTRGGGAESHDQ